MKRKGFRMSKLLLVVFLIVSVILPLVRLLMNVRIEDIQSVIQSPQFGSMILNSLATTSIATVISVGLAWVLAWCVNRTRIRFKSVFSVLFT